MISLYLMYCMNLKKENDSFWTFVLEFKVKFAQTMAFLNSIVVVSFLLFFVRVLQVEVERKKVVHIKYTRINNMQWYRHTMPTSVLTFYTFKTNVKVAFYVFGVLDGQNGIVILGFGATARNESQDSWDYFISLMKQHIPYLTDQKVDTLHNVMNNDK